MTTLRPRRAGRRRIERGDWQTPDALARAVVAQLAARGIAPRTVVEPTCGDGAFLHAAGERWPDATLRGYEIDPVHVQRARARLGSRAEIEPADFFAAPWEAWLPAGPGPTLVLGNPPWVTSAELGALRSTNLPPKDNRKRLSGLDAVTGKANFDVSEWMIVRLLRALQGTDATLAMLCKMLVARRVMEQVDRAAWPLVGTLHDIDATAHFGASVDAVLLTLRPTPRDAARPTRWPRFAGLEASTPSTIPGIVDGIETSHAPAFEGSRHLQGRCDPAWRSGLKHDCAAVMELFVRDGRLHDAGGAPLDLEDDHVFPLLKGSDVANGRWPPSRAVIVPQRALGDPTATMAARAPRTWAYLQRHRAALEARKSSIYAGQPPFAVFGVGPYTFMPWKVAIAGLYKRLAFTLVGPHQGKPVVFDDTTYFLPFATEAEAREALAALRCDAATDFFQARVFWDDKRPITKRVLQSLDLSALRQ